ncbi:transcription factor mef2A [Hyalella azteca]|uniref:Transcription factor mef2A n=1 Tax=Hyalella azteca TaxID=294128 RepID=A0A8B7MYP6_HYAAZ|nr:transcription factor mef2A [Hyalella azteca]
MTYLLSSNVPTDITADLHRCRSNSITSPIRTSKPFGSPRRYSMDYYSYHDDSPVRRRLRCTSPGSERDDWQMPLSFTPISFGRRQTKRKAWLSSLRRSALLSSVAFIVFSLLAIGLFLAFMMLILQKRPVDQNADHPKQGKANIDQPQINNATKSVPYVGKRVNGYPPSTNVTLKQYKAMKVAHQNVTKIDTKSSISDKNNTSDPDTLDNISDYRLQKSRDVTQNSAANTTVETLDMTSMAGAQQTQDATEKLVNVERERADEMMTSPGLGITQGSLGTNEATVEQTRSNVAKPISDTQLRTPTKSKSLMKSRRERLRRSRRGTYLYARIVQPTRIPVKMMMNDPPSLHGNQSSVSPKNFELPPYIGSKLGDMHSSQPTGNLPSNLDITTNTYQDHGHKQALRNEHQTQVMKGELSINLPNRNQALMPETNQKTLFMNQNQEPREHHSSVQHQQQILQHQFQAPVLIQRQLQQPFHQQTPDQVYQQEHVQTYQQSPEQVHQREPASMPQESPVQMPQQSPVQIPQQSPVQMHPQAPVQMHPQAPVQMQPQSPVQMHPQAPVQMHPQAPIQMHPQAPVQMHPLAPVQMHPHAPLIMHPQAPVQLHPQVPVQMNSQTPIQMYPQAPVQMHPQAPVQMHPHTPVQMHPQTPVQMHPQAPDQMHPQAPLQMHPQSPDQMHPQAPVQMHPQSPDQMHPQAPVQMDQQTPVQMHPQAQVQMHPQGSLQVDQQASVLMHPQELSFQMHPQVSAQAHQQSQVQLHQQSPQQMQQLTPVQMHQQPAAQVQQEAPVQLPPETHMPLFYRNNELHQQQQWGSQVRREGKVQEIFSRTQSAQQLSQDQTKFAELETQTTTGSHHQVTPHYDTQTSPKKVLEVSPLRSFVTPRENEHQPQEPITLPNFRQPYPHQQLNSKINRSFSDVTATSSDSTDAKFSESKFNSEIQKSAHQFESTNVMPKTNIAPVFSSSENSSENKHPNFAGDQAEDDKVYPKHVRTGSFLTSEPVSSNFIDERSEENQEDRQESNLQSLDDKNEADVSQYLVDGSREANGARASQAEAAVNPNQESRASSSSFIQTPQPSSPPSADNKPHGTKGYELPSVRLVRALEANEAKHKLDAGDASNQNAPSINQLNSLPLTFHPDPNEHHMPKSFHLDQEQQISSISQEFSFMSDSQEQESPPAQNAPTFERIDPQSSFLVNTAPTHQTWPSHMQEQLQSNSEASEMFSSERHGFQQRKLLRYDAAYQQPNQIPQTYQNSGGFYYNAEPNVHPNTAFDHNQQRRHDVWYSGDQRFSAVPSRHDPNLVPIDQFNPVWSNNGLYRIY